MNINPVYHQPQVVKNNDRSATSYINFQAKVQMDVAKKIIEPSVQYPGGALKKTGAFFTMVFTALAGCLGIKKKSTTTAGTKEILPEKFGNNIKVAETTSINSVQNYYNNEHPNVSAGECDSIPANVDSSTKGANYGFTILPVKLETLLTEHEKKFANEFYDALNRKDTKAIEKLLSQIDDKSAIDVAYEAIYDKDLEEEIIHCKGVDKKLTEKAFKIIHNYKDNLEIKDSKIKNDYWEGDSFDVKFDGNEVFIINNSTKEESYIDMDKLFKKFNPKDKVDMMKYFQELPGEVLFDISIECKEIDPIPNIKNRVNKLFGHGTRIGFYDLALDKIFIKDYVCIIHELGHAIDARYILKIINDFATNNNKKFKAAFKLGMERYKNAENKQYSRWKSAAKNRKSSYCTTNEREMFAECYKLLMTGHCSSEDAIRNYFPECLEEAKNILKATRKLPRNTRR